jgi:hypothetical protein
MRHCPGQSAGSADTNLGDDAKVHVPLRSRCRSGAGVPLSTSNSHKTIISITAKATSRCRDPEDPPVSFKDWDCWSVWLGAWLG